MRLLSSRAAAYYLAFRHAGPCRFDVLGLDAGEDGWDFTLVRDAFPFKG